MKYLFTIIIVFLISTSYSQSKKIISKESLSSYAYYGLDVSSRNRIENNFNSKKNEENYNTSLLKDFSKTGSISPDAVTIDATEIDDFHSGYAIIRKGENFAIITNEGKFFMPYGKYKFNILGGYEIDKSRCGFINEMCVVRDVETEKYGFIDGNGRLVVPCTLIDVAPFMEDGYAWAKEKGVDGKEYQEFINLKGRKYPVKNPGWYNSTPSFLNIYPVKANNGFTEYYNKTGKLVFKTKKKIAGQYSEGLIRVDTTYELIGKKAGFIDTTGKLVIPYKFKLNEYSNNLNDFHNGLAFYEPVNTEDSKYIYFNKKGEPALQLKLNDQIQQLYINKYSADFYGHVAYITANNKPAYIDESKTTFILPDDIENNNPDFSSKYKSFKVLYRESAHNYLLKQKYNFTVFEALMKTDVITKMTTSGFGGGREITKKADIEIRGLGITSVRGEILIAPLFDKISYPDIAYGLCLATYTDPNTNISTTGYVNLKGVFVIVQSKK